VSGEETPPVFTGGFRYHFSELVEWRRDVRRFLPTPIDPKVLDEILRLACLSPSVGNSQPWRFVLVEDAACRARIRHNFAAANSEALHAYQGEKAKLYATLKLSGLDVAPVQLAVFCETEPEEGDGLGRRTMPETLHYSVAGAVQTLALAARAWGIGVGWVSIIDPQDLKETLGVKQSWDLVSFLCLGIPEEEHRDPELERYGWQPRLPHARFITRV
jgi:5,6-dimethylbenzimidazole synthase